MNETKIFFSFIIIFFFFYLFRGGAIDMEEDNKHTWLVVFLSIIFLFNVN